MTASPLYDTDGNIMGAIEFIRDITRFKKQERELFKNHSIVKEIFNSTSEIILLNEILLGDTREGLSRRTTLLAEFSDILMKSSFRWRRTISNPTKSET